MSHNIDQEFIDESRAGEFGYAIASKGKRFANLFIDVVAYYFLSFVAGIFLVLMFPLNEGVSSTLLSYLIGAIVVWSYYAGFEYLTGGKTLGKIITKTRAVNIDGSKMDFSTIAKRSAARIIPFEAFTYLGDLSNGLHDRLSGTKVIDENTRTANKPYTYKKSISV